MRNFTAETVFTKRELRLLAEATALVARIPNLRGVEWLRCHEVTRAVGHVLKLPTQDGQYGIVDHSWLWTNRVLSGKQSNILDVYAVGSLPQVRLVAASFNWMPHIATPGYNPQPLRKDIDHDVVKRLIRALER